MTVGLPYRVVQSNVCYASVKTLCDAHTETTIPRSKGEHGKIILFAISPGWKIGNVKKGSSRVELFTTRYYQSERWQGLNANLPHGA